MPCAGAAPGAHAGPKGGPLCVRHGASLENTQRLSLFLQGEAVGVAAQWRSLSTPTPNTRQRQRLGLRLRSREWVTKREEQDRRQGVRGAARPASSCVLRASPSATLRAEVMAPAASSLPTQTGRAPPPAPPRPCLLTRAGRPPPPSYSHWEGEAWQVLRPSGGTLWLPSRHVEERLQDNGRTYIISPFVSFFSSQNVRQPH